MNRLNIVGALIALLLATFVAQPAEAYIETSGQMTSR